MFKKILYPTDFSQVSRKAMDYCKKLKAAGTEEVILLHVIEIDPNIEKLPEKIREGFLTLLRGEPQGELDKMKGELEEAGIRTRVRIERGNPIKEILRVEEEEDVSAVIIGSHGKSNLEEVILGSVSENVVRKSTKPVLVIKR